MRAGSSEVGGRESHPEAGEEGEEKPRGKEWNQWGRGGTERKEMRDSGRSAGGNGKRSGDLELRMALPCPWPPPLPLFALYTLAVLFPHRPLLPVSGSPAPASGSTIVLFSLGLHPSHRNSPDLLPFPPAPPSPSRISHLFPLCTAPSP